uniref:Large ribosomal subunit protein uL10c n=1 Tax=Wollemia nobilis TaxID=56998 RepID=A0A0C9RFZ6_9CONI
MEVQASTHFCHFSSFRKSSNPSSSTGPTSACLQRSPFWGRTTHLSKLPGPHIHFQEGTRSLKVQCAISRSKKEETVENVKQQLENCYLVAGIRYKGFTVKQFQDLRRSLPESSKLVVAKNNLVGKAIEGTQWEALKPCMKGMNAWLFVHSEEIPTALKPYRTFQKQQKLEENDFTGAVFEGKFYAPEEFKALETMPTRAEIYAKLLGSLQSPAISLVTTLQAPARDLVLTLKAYVQKLEEEAGSATTS